MEWLPGEDKIRMVCATSTIAQGMNFPVASVFLASRYVPHVGHSPEMAPREFWNLAGRAGRIDHDSVGVVGLCQGKDRDATINFLSRSTGALVSRLLAELNKLEKQGSLAQLSEVLGQDQWVDFRCYIAHLWAQMGNLDVMLAESEQLLRQTYGYTSMRNDPTQVEKADALLDATRSYVRKLARMPPGTAELADSTGFSPEGIKQAIRGIGRLEDNLSASDLAPESLFGKDGRMADLFGVMLKVPQLMKQLSEVKGKGAKERRLSDITADWVNGRSLEEIAREHFKREKDDEEGTAALTDACKAIYRAIANNGTWGVSALSRMSGIKLDELSEDDKRRINVLPAMIYHGVRSEDAVLMRMNSVPRSAAEKLGAFYRQEALEDPQQYSVANARHFLKDLDSADWDRVRPQDAPLSGAGYKRVWEVLSGEAG